MATNLFFSGHLYSRSVTTLHLATRVKPTNGCHREAQDPRRLRQQSRGLAVVYGAVGAMLCCQQGGGHRQAASDPPERLWRSHLQADSEPCGPDQAVGPLVFGHRRTREGSPRSQAIRNRTAVSFEHSSPLAGRIHCCFHGRATPAHCVL